MNLQEFTKNAVKTESLIDEVRCNKELLETALGMFVAVSIILDNLKKNIFYGKEMNWDSILNNAHFLFRSSEWLKYSIGDFNNEHNQSIDVNSRLFHAVVGVCTESGEIAESMLRAILDKGEIDRVNLAEEFGDLDWYKAIAVDEMQINPNSILEAVIEKLQARYPDKFDSDKAINRDLDRERGILENKLE